MKNKSSILTQVIVVWCEKNELVWRGGDSVGAVEMDTSKHFE